jgi:hypothetical protein
MFEKALPPLPENPFKSLEGLYEVKYQLSLDDILNPIRYNFTTKLVHHYADLRAVIDLYQRQNPKASLSSILKVLNVPDSDIAKLPPVSGKEIVEVWEVTTKEKDIIAMGKSKHFASCYSGGVQPKSIIQAAQPKGLALVRRLDKNKELKERFLITADIDVGEGRFGIKSRIRASNFKSPTGAYATTRIQKIFDSLVSEQVRKLTSEEAKDFKWE